ncbi:collagen alpha-1(XII) chain-like [Pomacea canaliculata]|uniref:collagen alpha-1(XII) chain-like n=1 Tax=Pomacea canaliculata TaxID=400727 RepID=UPI000D7393D5|nr:collagen alpha-1(XII) chain-like [Pomacea canaliculata]
MDVAVKFWRLSPLLLLLLALSEFSVVSAVSTDCSSTVMDLVVVADSSTSIKRANYKLMKEFLAKVVSGLPTDDLHVRMAIVRFSNEVDIILNLTQSETNDNLTKILTSMAFVGGGTNTYTALQTVREQILIPANGRRPEVPAVVLVVTDGESWNVNRTKSEASLLKNLDVNILALGIGSNVSLNELNGISSGFVQNISDFDSLDGIVDSLRGQLCKTAVESISVRTTLTSESGSSPALDTAVTFPIADDTSSSGLDPTPGPTIADDTSSPALDPTPAPTIADDTSSPALDPTPAPTIADDTSSPALDPTPGPTIADDTSSPALDPTPGPTIADDTSSPALDSTPGPTTSDKTSSTVLDSTPGPITDDTSSPGLESTPGPTIVDDTSSPALDSTLNFIPVTPHSAGLSTSDLRRCFEQRVDLVFVVDASYSVKEENFERAKSFINKIVSGLPIGQTAVRVALVRFDRDVSIINHFLDNLQAVTDSVWNMTYPDAAGTNTGGALKEVREKVFDVRKEDGVKDIVITITDGESDQVDVTEEQASLLRDQGAQLVWLYIYKGGGPLEDEKNFMEEQGDSVIVVDHFDKLTDDIVSKDACGFLSRPDYTFYNNFYRTHNGHSDYESVYSSRFN